MSKAKETENVSLESRIFNEHYTNLKYCLKFKNLTTEQYKLISKYQFNDTSCFNRTKKCTKNRISFRNLIGYELIEITQWLHNQQDAKHIADQLKTLLEQEVCVNIQIRQWLSKQEN